LRRIYGCWGGRRIGRVFHSRREVKGWGMRAGEEVGDAEEVERVGGESCWSMRSGSVVSEAGKRVSSKRKKTSKRARSERTDR